MNAPSCARVLLAARTRAWPGERVLLAVGDVRVKADTNQYVIT